MSLDDRIDELYRLPLADFTASRNAVAKTLSGDEAKRVRSLTKPTVVPWAVNQLFWRARLVYDRLLKSGSALREAQIAALKGQSADVRHATEAHRRALTEAVRRATELTSAEGPRPDTDGLSRMLEALSLSHGAPGHPGRLTEPLHPAGFEALSGVQPVRATEAGVGRSSATVAPGTQPRAAADLVREQEARRRQETERREAEQRRLECDLRSAEQAAAQARADETRAQEALDRARDERRAAAAALFAARKAVDDLH